MRILITGCSMHSYDLISAMRANENDEEVYLVGINCTEEALLRKGVNAGYVVPRITEPDYLPTVLDICLKEKVDVILPFITAELPIMAENRDYFEKHGIHVSVSSKESLDVCNDKVALGKLYGDMMPMQRNVRSINDIYDFADEIGYPRKTMCCKLPNRCGGLGFCIVDEEKGRDLTIVNKFGMNKYITFDMLLTYYKNLDDTLILQEYEEGSDYSMCILADHGDLVHGLGFEATMMSFGSAIYAKISQNEKAMDIARKITKETGLDGNACFDFILKPDGDVILLEVNPRLSATLPFIARAGLNLPYLRCRQLMGYDVRSHKPEINFDLKMSKNYESEYFV